MVSRGVVMVTSRGVAMVTSRGVAMMTSRGDVTLNFKTIPQPPPMFQASFLSAETSTPNTSMVNNATSGDGGLFGMFRQKFNEGARRLNSLHVHRATKN